MNAADRTYGILVGEADIENRVCEDIPEEACREVPGSFLLNLANGACTKLAEKLASPGLVLPWLFGALGVPQAYAGWLMPLRRAGSMFPQLAMSGAIRSKPKRKLFWTLAGSIQAAALAGMIPAAALLEPAAAGAVILLLLAVFSVASGMGSVAFSDVVGKTIPKRRRGRLLGWRGAVGGVLTVAAGLVLRFFIDGREELTIYLVLIGIAAGLWAVAALLFALIQERPGATAGAATPLKELREGWKLIREQSGFRRYLLTRIMLMVGVELALPYYSLHGRQVAGPEIGGLGVFVVVSGIAAALSSTIWGSAADKSSRRTMIVAGGISLATALLALANAWVPAELASAWTYSPVFFLFGVAVAGVRMGRKTYIVDAVPAEQRATYVATGNTLVGAAGLASGLLGFALAAWGVRWLIVALAALSAAGSLGALLTPEAEQMRRRTEA